MIITANGVQHNVDILTNFTPVYTRALKFDKTLSGKYYVSDRGPTNDKYSCKITVIGDDSDVTTLVDNLYREHGQTEVDTEGIKIFGDGIDHSNPFTCNFTTNKYPIRNVRNTTLDITLVVVSEIVYDTSIPIELPELFYSYPVNRTLTPMKTNYDTMAYGDYGVMTKVDFLDNALKTEVLDISVSIDCNEFGKLHRYVADLRGDSFLLNTNSHFKTFLNSNSEEVKILKFSYKYDGPNYWKVKMSLTNSFT